MSYSKLVVKNFGKIKEAEIELSDLVLFIGDNNSGKSYLMTLIYGFSNYSEEIVSILFQDKDFLFSLKEYKDIENIINKHLEYNKENYSQIIEAYNYCFINAVKNRNIFCAEQTLDEKFFLSLEELKLFNDLFNLLLNKHKEKILQFIFNDINNFINLDYINLNIYKPDFKILLEHKNKISILYKKHLNEFSISGNIPDFSTLNIIIYIFSIMTKYIFNIKNNKMIFLPTSRTGFFLSYKELAKQSVTSAFNIENQKIKTLFQKPISDFINNLIDLSKEYKANEGYANIIEIFHDMIQGDIEVNTETGGYYYKPNNTDLKIPMYLNSAVITEIAPLYLFLKYGKDIGTLFIEEPEMSLHLKLQKQIARIIINLVNKNINLIISTHSDTILEHINNMLKLNSINDKDKKNNLLKKYSYTENDIIDIEKIRIYQFNTDKDNTTNIIPLEGNKKTGFYIETFHDYINKASNEYDEINESI
ncbi:AAA family ATPase [Brachyspira intermedia]|uniref:AAA family ATPase n=1 Tax=Brachyspira intermedia TaxID=84377 RepID=UPI00300689EC